MAEKDVSLAYADGTGSFLVLLAMAEQQRLFGKYGVDVRSVAIKGATVPRLTADMPLGVIGEPAALLQVAEGADLRLVASFSDIKLSGHLVARPGINTPGDLRGKRLGARVIGAGLWISTILALEQLALDPRRDEITILPVGNPVQIFRALEQGELDAALVSAAQSRELQAKGFTALFDGLPARHKQLWRWAGCLQWLSVEQSRCGFEGRACTFRSPGDVSWRTAQDQGHAGVQCSPQHHRRRKRCKQFRRAATQAVSLIGSVGKDAESDLAP